MRKVYRQNQEKSYRAVFSRCQRERSRKQIQYFKNDRLHLDEGSQEKAEARSSRHEKAQGASTPLRAFGEIH